MTIQDVFGALTDIIEVVWTTFGMVLDTIVGNPLFLVPVLIGLAGAVSLFAVSMVRKLGVRGVSSAGGSRRRRSRA